jgi:hypothetical protein
MAVARRFRKRFAAFGVRNYRSGRVDDISAKKDGLALLQCGRVCGI